MIKILCITESLAGGGAEHQMSILANMLFKKGYNVTLATYADLEDHYDIDEGIKRIRLAVGKSGVVKLLALFRLILTTDSTHVISYRCPCNVRVMVPAIFRRNIRYIVGERNTNLSGKPKKNEKWAIDRKLYNYADVIVPNSYTQGRYIESRKPEWKEKIRVIINYTDLNQFIPSSLPAYNGTLKVAIFARLSRQKNALGLINMLSLLKQSTDKHISIDWYCSLKGTDGNYTKEYLEHSRFAEQTGVSNLLTFKPAIKNPATVMSEYHAICLPSLYEGFSNSIAEGICSGKPMLVGNVSDNSIMVRDGVNGYLFDPRDRESMCDAFIKMANLNNSELQRMATKSREIAESLFNESKFINEYIKLL